MSPTLTTSTHTKPDALENAQGIVPMLRLAFDAKRDIKTVETTFNDETIPYLLKAASYADPDFRAEIETLLVHLGASVVPVMVDALAHNSNVQVASVAAMVLIRLGQVSENDLLNAYSVNQNSDYAWRFDFVMNQLRLTTPVLTV